MIYVCNAEKSKIHSKKNFCTWKSFSICHLSLPSLWKNLSLQGKIVMQVNDMKPSMSSMSILAKTGRKAPIFKKLVAISGGTFLMVFAPVTYADWQICNRTPTALYAAIAYDNGNGGYSSSGWYRVESCGACKTVFRGRPHVSGVFVHGSSEDGALAWGNDFLFCVHPTQRFLYSGQANLDDRVCKQQGGIMEPFALQTLKGGTFTTNLTGRHPSGRVCID